MFLTDRRQSERATLFDSCNCVLTQNLFARQTLCRPISWPFRKTQIAVAPIQSGATAKINSTTSQSKPLVEHLAQSKLITSCWKDSIFHGFEQMCLSEIPCLMMLKLGGLWHKSLQLSLTGTGSSLHSILSLLSFSFAMVWRCFTSRRSTFERIYRCKPPVNLKWLESFGR